MFRDQHIHFGGNRLMIDCEFEYRGEPHNFHLQKEVGKAAIWEMGGKLPKTKLESTEMHRRTHKHGHQPSEHPDIAVLFSTQRGVAKQPRINRKAAAGGATALLSRALSPRPLAIQELAAWMKAQQALGRERSASRKILDSLEMAIGRFLPGYTNLQPTEDGKDIAIDRRGERMFLGDLSDGELGMLAIVLDMTRIMAQANPDLSDPAASVEAVVLIDEIELHLHPAWQRQIVRRLTDTFPRCQFIATTHSPQVIGEVEHECLHIMDDDGVHSPTCSFGVDSNRVLEEIMNTNPRTEAVEELLKKISDAIVRNQYEDARSMLAKLSGYLGENDPEIARAETLIRFMTEDS